ncbi:MAG: O-antigen polymerase [Candidatus Gottesmanbacteria bacterium GW2011_GWB1_43_11]|uniref:O-antigen polymerase n=1 Tax=Candidatus Gottesmanbacteria bacterium GW2011_GWB1_43_11 TaxID=1618446 RepID=A0A0G1CMQ3_9BACT|nr:MAG: O-antigen polymerase [Candidatus Gottesmanbacteria bacterium GW2011_GWA2_42_16]KKS55850.1 MAG: O-antigen polymerase [Candidatus Gottesmanbacteria bacterium GW2011_GWA1_42_26]KKS81251.1 MAG: O-antigen polymerase [Candidatus Gottesmanbacteria bacterium GW2011_GWC1_43_10]KKS86767.1 MAG: O-antigen polymerase [Candidatus Gottesmanbacteria bacterium GW2011_GWB1_43_11]OGG09841.1 MAG: hypothetical protein A2699_00560 [Candidatus Gottesmanbacteria bacterium RIFCSPHIGHO2_01_FULL_43_15]OGG27934.1
MTRFKNSLFFLLLVLLPTQLGKHIWLDTSLVLGRRIDYLSPTLYLTDAILLSAATVYFLAFNLGARQRFCILSLGFWVIGIGLWILPHPSLISFYVWFRFWIIGVIAWLVKERQPKMREVLIPLGLGVVGSAILAAGQFLLQRAVGGPAYFLGERSFLATSPGIAQVIINGRLYLRPYATFSHPNVLGGFLATVLPIFLFTKIKKQRFFKMDFLILTSVAYSIWLGIFISFSRIAWLAALGSSGFFLFAKAKRRFWWGVLAVVILLVVMEEMTLGRFGNLFSVDIESISERQQLFQASLIMIGSSPLLGSGLGSFISNLPQVLIGSRLLQPVHSIYLLILSETGIVGFALFLFLIGKTIMTAISKHRSAALAALITILFLGLFDHYFYTLPQTQLLFGVVLGLIYA